MKYVIAALVFLSSCASIDVFREQPLELQVLKFRTGYKSLTHRHCSDWLPNGECKNYAVKEYDLSQKDTRKLLNDLSFICKIAHKRYKILVDSPLFANDEYYRCGIFKLKRCRNRNTLDVTKVEYLRQANAKCFSYKQYSFDTF